MWPLFDTYVHVCVCVFLFLFFSFPCVQPFFPPPPLFLASASFSLCCFVPSAQMYHAAFRRRQARRVKFSYLIVKKTQHTLPDEYLAAVAAARGEAEQEKGGKGDDLLAELASFCGTTASPLFPSPLPASKAEERRHNLHNPDEDDEQQQQQQQQQQHMEQLHRIVKKPSRKKGMVCWLTCAPNGLCGSLPPFCHHVLFIFAI